MEERVWVISSTDGGMTWVVDWTSPVAVEEDPGYYVWSPREFAIKLASFPRIDGHLAYVTEDQKLLTALIDQGDQALACEVTLKAEAQAVTHGHVYSVGYPA